MASYIKSKKNFHPSNNQFWSPMKQFGGCKQSSTFDIYVNNGEEIPIT